MLIFGISKAKHGKMRFKLIPPAFADIVDLLLYSSGFIAVSRLKISNSELSIFIESLAVDKGKAISLFGILNNKVCISRKILREVIHMVP